MTPPRLKALGRPFDPPRGVERTTPEDPLARILGWTSLALGAAPLATPGRFARSIGLRADATTRTCAVMVGLRELGAGAGILSQRRPSGWLWARVAGDAKDLALLRAGLRSRAVASERTYAAIAAVVGITAADVVAALRHGPPAALRDGGAASIRAAVTVRRPPEEVYAFWHRFENLPTFMTHLESVEMVGQGRSHWKVKAPAGRTIEWDAETTVDRPNETIAWRSLPGSRVKTSGTVAFRSAPAGQGTEIVLDMRYSPPGGIVGATVAKLSGEEPRRQVEDDLRRFKQVMETGIVTRSEGSPEGTLAFRQLKQRPAQPMPTGADR
jgi:uncharacterized membrane protein